MKVKDTIKAITEKRNSDNTQDKQVSSQLTIIKKNDKTILKRGKKVYAEITYNENPDYKFMIWFKGGMALSGYETEQAAIDRANEMNKSWNETISELLKQF